MKVFAVEEALNWSCMMEDRILTSLMTQTPLLNQLYNLNDLFDEKYMHNYKLHKGFDAFQRFFCSSDIVFFFKCDINTMNFS